MTISLRISPSLRSAELNALFASAWPDRRGAGSRRRSRAKRSKPAPLRHALFYVCAYDGKQLIGFAKVIGDGGVHGFLLDPTVAPAHQRQGIGRQLVEACAQESRRRGIEWLHVDYVPRLKKFYATCGFSDTTAGLRNLMVQKMD